MAKTREFRQQTRIARPPDLVWALMTDPRAAPLWIRGLKQSTPVTAGPLAAGSKLRESRVVMGTTSNYDLEVRVFEPPKRYVVAALEGKTRYVYDFQLADTGGVTDVFLHAFLEDAGALKAALVFNTWEEYEKDRLAMLKVAVEARFPPASRP